MLEDFRVLVRPKVAVVPSGFGVGQNDAIDQLLEAPLPRLGAHSPAEVLRRDDRRRVHAPKVGELNPLLLEHHLPGLPVVLHHVTAFPCDVVVGMPSRRGVEPLHRQAGGLERVVHELCGCADCLGHRWCLSCWSGTDGYFWN